MFNVAALLRQGECRACGKTTEVYVVSSDIPAISGMLCAADFRRLVRLSTITPASEPNTIPATDGKPESNNRKKAGG